MGTPEFAVAPLAALSNDSDFQIMAVITQQDKPVGRKQVLTPPLVKVYAESKGLNVLQPEKINNPEFIQQLEALNPDFIVVVAYGKILPQAILDIPKYCPVNLHPSLLPKYRGAIPVEQAILNGDKTTGLTFIKMSQEMDAGPILLTQKLNIEESDDALSLRQKLSLFGARLLPFLLKDIVDGNVHAINQNDSLASFCKKITKEDGKIDLKQITAVEFINKIKAYSIWPNCTLEVSGKKIKILKAKEVKTKQDLAKGEIALATKSGYIAPLEVQLEGKKPMIITEFLKGQADFFKGLTATNI